MDAIVCARVSRERDDHFHSSLHCAHFFSLHYATTTITTTTTCYCYYWCCVVRGGSQLCLTPSLPSSSLPLFALPSIEA